MKAIIIHGWEGKPGEAWQKWLKVKLEEKGWKVETPKMPNSAEPKINEWVGKLKELENIDDKTYFIGHSIGCQAILRYLETLDGEKVGGCVFVAPWMELDEKTIEEEGEEVKEIARPWVETPINWEKVKQHTSKFICILSDNDYYVPLTNKELFEKNLNAEVFIEKEKGHFAPQDNVDELPIVLEKIEELVK